MKKIIQLSKNEQSAHFWLVTFSAIFLFSLIKSDSGEAVSMPAKVKPAKSSGVGIAKDSGGPYPSNQQGDQTDYQNAQSSQIKDGRFSKEYLEKMAQEKAEFEKKRQLKPLQGVHISQRPGFNENRIPISAIASGNFSKQPNSTQFSSAAEKELIALKNEILNAAQSGELWNSYRYQDWVNRYEAAGQRYLNDLNSFATRTSQNESAALMQNYDDSMRFLHQRQVSYADHMDRQMASSAQDNTLQSVSYGKQDPEITSSGYPDNQSEHQKQTVITEETVHDSRPPDNSRFEEAASSWKTSAADVLATGKEAVKLIGANVWEKFKSNESGDLIESEKEVIHDQLAGGVVDGVKERIIEWAKNKPVPFFGGKSWNELDPDDQNWYGALGDVAKHAFGILFKRYDKAHEGGSDLVNRISRTIDQGTEISE